MKNKRLVCASLCLALASLAAAQSQGAVGVNSNEPLLPYSPSLDLSSMDRAVDPCGDFFQYSCGGWQKKNPMHELTHGFDDQGSKFDAHGNLRELWTKEDRQKFEDRTKCVAD